MRVTWVYSYTAEIFILQIISNISLSNIKKNARAFLEKEPQETTWDFVSQIDAWFHICHV